jgi:hypothetical protein
LRLGGVAGAALWSSVLQHCHLKQKNRGGSGQKLVGHRDQTPAFRDVGAEPRFNALRKLKQPPRRGVSQGFLTPNPDVDSENRLALVAREGFSPAIDGVGEIHGVANAGATYRGQRDRRTGEHERFDVVFPDVIRGHEQSSAIRNPRALAGGDLLPSGWLGLELEA